MLNKKSLKLWLLPLWLFAQYIQSGCDTVFAFSPGSGQNIGQDSAYFPQNVLGLPDPNATPTSPSSSPYEILSLGEKGAIVLGWKNYVLVDGPGPDFIVFENAFYYGNNQVFAEPGIVSVSKDGIQFYTFPFDTLTLVGCAGMTPTNGAANPFDPTQAGGDAFDLSTIGIDSIRYIRIEDFCWYIKQDPNHPYYSPLLSGFDLDAITARYLVPMVSTTAQQQHLKVQKIKTDSGYWLRWQTPISGILYLYDLTGREIAQWQLNQTRSVFISMEQQSKGLYFLKSNYFHSQLWW